MFCAMTLKRKEMDETALIDGVGTVPDGIIEIINNAEIIMLVITKGRPN